MKQHSKLSSGQQQQQAAAEQQTQEQSLREFASAEELLRHDTLHTVVPPRIEQRLRESIKGLPQPRSRSWWQRFFGGTKP